jgi:glycosyltransferase involved in cell wall biosynthesis
MRIALITPEYPGCGPSFGVGRYVRDLGECLGEAGNTVQVLAATDTGCFTITPGQSPQLVGPAYPHLLLRPLQAARWLDHELARFAPDVLDVPNWGGLGTFLRTPIPHVVRLVTSAADPSLARRDPLLPVRLTLENATVQRAAMLVADSAAMGEVGHRIYGRMTDTVIHLAYRGQITPPTPRSNPAVLFIGRMEPRKGADILLDAWPSVLVACPTAHLHVVGPDRSGLEPRLTNAPGVTWHGQADDATVSRLRGQCLVQAIPSRFESFGLVALEAWAAGMSVVASDVGGLPAIIGDAGLLVPTEKPAALAQALISALEPRLARQMADAGQRRLKSLFDPAQLVRRSLEVYAMASNRTNEPQSCT